MRISSPKKVTLRDVAAAAGVSPATVSHIMNGKLDSFSTEATKIKVRKAAAELGYRKNIGYQLMHHQSTRTVGIMVANEMMMQQEHYRELVLQLIRKMEDLSYAAFCHIMPHDNNESLQTVRDYIARGVEHFIFIGCPVGWQIIDDECARLGITAVFTREYTKRYVSHDTASGLEILFRYMQKLCGENFKHLCYANWLDAPENNRIMALQRIFPQYSRQELIDKFCFVIPERPDQSDFMEGSWQAGRKGMKKLLKQFPRIQGVSFFTDSLAWGGTSLLLEEKYASYRSLVLTGCNYDPVMRHFALPFSTLEFNVSGQVEALIQAALDNSPCQKLIPTITHIQQIKKGTDQ